MRMIVSYIERVAKPIKIGPLIEMGYEARSVECGYSELDATCKRLTDAGHVISRVRPLCDAGI